MVNVIIHLHVHPTEIEAFKDLTTRNIDERRTARGNLRAELFQQVDTPEHFVLIESFDKQENIDTYYQSSTYVAWHHKVLPMIEKWEGSDFWWLV